ncbi:chaperone modulator CbpM [Marinilongibacter aquaticus]|uniref:chaperone modulator CbpM n=1 Tax=Marinilongibacter aquaticus TaxID=2975157 RepID=UPI0021BD6145|nr:chaperone modulator CbpM [Marinilongibacter aquaticus]UBM58569.1 chaperone modulator CbpM [Marinilongibacter aquaticus]
MDIQEFILIDKLCSHYDLESTFFEDLAHAQLIEISIFENLHYVHKDEIQQIERVIRLHYDLHINIEGIDAILNLLEKQKELHETIEQLRSKLSIYEEV